MKPPKVLRKSLRLTRSYWAPWLAALLIVNTGNGT